MVSSIIQKRIICIVWLFICLVNISNGQGAPPLPPKPVVPAPPPSSSTTAATSSTVSPTTTTTKQPNTGYVYDFTKYRPELGVPKPTGVPWDGIGPRPSVPGIVGLNETKIVEIPSSRLGEDLCKTYYPNMQHGVYRAPNSTKYNAPHFFYYPFKSWVKNCDVHRFLRCVDFNGEAHCRCWPGMYWEVNRTVPGRKTRGMCVVGYHGNCSVFKAYDFWIQRTCGQNMVCNDKTETCECDPANPDIIFTNDKYDEYHHQKFACRKLVNLNINDPCREHRAHVMNEPGKYTTKTECGDIGPEDNYEHHFYCKFPYHATGDHPVDEKGNPVQYGQREGGICSCTEDTFGWVKGKGCRPKSGALCFNGTVNFTGRIQPNHTNTQNLQTTCADDKPGSAYCLEGDGETPGKCVCTANHSTSLISGLCEPGVRYTLNITEGTDCNLDEHCNQLTQNCYNHECICKKGWKADEESKLCKGLYGIKCDKITDCYLREHETKNLTGFHCINIPEMTLLNSEKFPDGQGFCVCKADYLYEVSGYCGSCTLNPIQFGCLILFIYMIKILQPFKY